jgi:hypothetical protein
MSSKVFSVKTLVGVLGAVAVLTSGIFLRAPASANNSDDGRIETWRNSLGTVNVYCVDQNGDPASSVNEGGILVMDGTGHKILFASNQQIDAVEPDPAHKAAIASGSVYTLYRQPDGGFELDSLPDVNGKTFLGAWTPDCAPAAH